MEYHPHCRDRRRHEPQSTIGLMWNWARSGFTVALLGAIVVYSVKIVRAHSRWMDAVEVNAAKFSEFDAKWKPQIVTNTSAIAAINETMREIRTDTRDIKRMFEQHLIRMDPRAVE